MYSSVPIAHTPCPVFSRKPSPAWVESTSLLAGPAQLSICNQCVFPNLRKSVLLLAIHTFYLSLSGRSSPSRKSFRGCLAVARSMGLVESSKNLKLFARLGNFLLLVSSTSPGFLHSECTSSYSSSRFASGSFSCGLPLSLNTPI